MTSPPHRKPEGGAEEGGRRFQFQVLPTQENPIPSQPSQPGSPPTQGRSRRQENSPEKKAPPSDPVPPRPSRSRWRKNSVLSPSRARKLARSRPAQPRPPNPPRNPCCFFRPTISGRAEQSSPTATAIPILNPTLLAPAPNRLPIQPPTPTPLPTPDFRSVRSLSERTRSFPVSGPFAPLVSEPSHPTHPARSLP
ncbi:hypothetical protein MTP99_004602 [Tenebrio molitor]|jgi:hypothetical protein|nr:hypothetical protein MTP99_004602 [Tenebrio molitor]